KREVVKRYLRQQGIASGEQWIGFALEERRRVAKLAASDRDPKWSVRFPLVELMITTEVSAEIVRKQGLPPAPISSCWMCPHKRNAEWRALSADEFEAACLLDEEVREEDIARGGPGVWLHHSKVPLREADLSDEREDRKEIQCSFGS